MMTVSTRLKFEFPDEGFAHSVFVKREDGYLSLENVSGSACIRIPLADVAEFARRIAAFAGGAHTEPAQADEPDEEGWIKWEGGECPVSPWAWVAIRMQNGQVHGCIRADVFSWEHEGAPDWNIIAYRPSEKQGGDE